METPKLATLFVCIAVIRVYYTGKKLGRWPARNYSARAARASGVQALVADDI